MKNTDEFHMTVQFLGDGILSAEPIIEALKNVSFKPFEIEMGNALLFPNVWDPRGAWIECRLSQELKKLAEDVQSEMKKIGYISDKPFKAHITLGRYRQTPEKKPEVVKGEPHRFTVENFHLMESTLTPKGPIHKKLATFQAGK
jgi:2'-5' RNA ligase